MDPSQAAQIGSSAGDSAWSAIYDFLASFFDAIDSAGMPGDLVTLLVAFIGSFAILWALWYGFKALRKAFSKANF